MWNRLRMCCRSLVSILNMWRKTYLHLTQLAKWRKYFNARSEPSSNKMKAKSQNTQWSFLGIFSRFQNEVCLCDGLKTVKWNYLWLYFGYLWSFRITGNYTSPLCKTIQNITLTLHHQNSELKIWMANLWKFLRHLLDIKFNLAIFMSCLEAKLFQEQ